jgi:hypothetical protein
MNSLIARNSNIYSKIIYFNTTYKRNINHLISNIYSINQIFNNRNNITLSSQLIKKFSHYNNNNNNNIKRNNDVKYSINSRIVDAYRNNNISEVSSFLLPENIDKYVRISNYIFYYYLYYYYYIT